LEIAVDHVKVINGEGNETVLDFSMDLVFLLEDKDHNQIHSEYRLLRVCWYCLTYSTQV
jgi:hypothetical protein